MAIDTDGRIRIGTRGSLLATTQAGVIRDALIARGHPAELVIISTEGDRSDRPVAEIGVGVFTAALREAVADGRVDMAVHSYKDLPTAPDARFVIAAVPCLFIRKPDVPWRVLIVISLAMLLPLVFLVSNAFKTPAEIIAAGPKV